jgi:phenylpropionate dioxygenase-like ring-hydroxylating dioxygenase large terminal subunit
MEPSSVAADPRRRVDPLPVPRPISTEPVSATLVSANLGNSDPALRHAWHPIGSVTDISAGLDKDHRPFRATVASQSWAIAKLGGQWRAFHDRCPHRRVQLSQGRIDGDEIECGYHGWRFDGSGACTSVPALGTGVVPPRGMAVQTAYGVIERYGWLWLAPAAPIVAMPDFPEFDDPEFAWGLLPPITTTASAGVVADNFFDVAHFSYLHARTFGLSMPVTVEHYTTGRSGWQATLVHETPLHEVNSPDGNGELRRATYTAFAPLALHLRLEFPATGMRSAVILIATPNDEQTTTIYKAVAWPRSAGAAELTDQVALEIAIIAEDIAMIEHIEEPWLPLDLHTEQHTKADRASVELRRLLSDFVSAAADDTVQQLEDIS